MSDNVDDPLLDNAQTDLSSSTADAQRKFIKLDVPDFDTNPPNNTPQRSYLRIGAVESDDPLNQTNFAYHGEDLAKKVTSFRDDTRVRDKASAANPNAYTRFADSAALVAESQRLHTKGGWRDHTDGNRVTTTRGDKVEVIGGNYKMLVLGRTTEALHEIDSSGGLLQDIDQTSYAVSEIEWVDRFGGTWMVKTEGSKGDYHSITEGYHSDHHTGDTVSTHIGNATESHTGTASSTHTGNATSTHTGDANETHNGKATSVHNGDTDSTTAGTTYKDISTHVNYHEFSAYVDKTDLSAGVASIELCALAKTFSLAITALSSSIDIYGKKMDLELGICKNEICLVPVHNQIHTGVVNEVDLSKHSMTTSFKVLSALAVFI